MRYFCIASLLFFLSLGLSGCSNSNTDSVDDPLKPALEDFAQFLKALPSDGVKPPKKLEEFLPREPMAPVAAEYLQNGKLVYFWGTDLKAGGQSVVAYEKGTDSTGGWVLLEDGKVKKMTSEEFAKAPKPSKK
jgi:hypothetical protein